MIPMTVDSVALRNALSRGRNPKGQRRWPRLSMHMNVGVTPRTVADCNGAIR